MRRTPPPRQGVGGKWTTPGGSTIKVGCWNVRALSPATFEQCKAMKMDVLGLSETHDAKPHLRPGAGTTYLHGAPVTEEDPAAGVGILLSANMAKCVVAHGHDGPRHVWCRIRCADGIRFILSSYIPVFGRKKPPLRKDGFDGARRCLSLARPSDIVIWIGDMNARLGRCMPEDIREARTPTKKAKTITGPFSVHREANEGGEMMAEVLRDHGLCAASTYFKQPTSWNKERPRARSNATFQATPKTGDKPTPDAKPPKMPTQIDYVCISQRWRSAVLSATVKWGGCKERFGYTRFDHALIECKIRVTLRATPKTPKAKDWGTTDPRVWA